MTLEDFIAEVDEIMNVKHVSTKLVEDYPEYTLAEPLQEPAEHPSHTKYRAWWTHGNS